MPPLLTGPVLAAALLLMAAAPGKLRRPSSTGRALAALRLPSSTLVVRLLAVGELALGAAVLVDPRPVVVALLGGAYAGFAVVVALALRAGTPLSSCGCFGRPDTPPTGVHLAVVTGLVVAAAAGAVTGVGSLADIARSGVGTGIPLLAATGLTAWLAWAAMALVPAVRAAARPAAPRRSLPLLPPAAREVEVVSR